MLEGAGFPENRPGTVTLVGTFHAPARAPWEVTWEFPVVAESRTSIRRRLTEKDLREQLRDAPHVTFTGRASVQFPPLLPGRPSLSGSSQKLGLDFFSSRDDATAHKHSAGRTLEDAHPTSAATNAAGESFEQFLGVELGEDLRVVRVVPGGAAARAGLLVGDVLKSLDRVHLASRADFLPQARGRVATIEYRRVGEPYTGDADEGDAQSSIVHIERAHFQVLDPHLAARSLAILVGIVCALCAVARPPRFLIWVLFDKPKSTLGKRQFLIDVSRSSQILAYPSFVVSVVCYYLLVTGALPQLQNLDFALCFALGTTLLAVGAFWLGGSRSGRGGFSLLGALGAATTQLVSLLPFSLACIFRASELGTLRLTELAQAQGLWPHEWAAVSSPWTLLLSIAALLCLVPVGGRRAPLEGQRAKVSAAILTGRVLEWTGHLVLLGLVITLFFGSSTDIQSAWLGAALLSGKFALLARLLAELRTRTGRMRLFESGGLSVKLSFGLCVAAGLLGGAQFALHGVLVPYEWLQLVALTLSTAVVFLAVVSSPRSWAHSGRKSDPWI